MAVDPPTLAPDPLGVLIKPIPDRLVVLTFDDAPASHATVVAPILKSLGFGASMYVCDFDSFRTRKDWYLTWRQMQVLNRDGFEIGNHTVGHGGGLENYLRMEDELLANHIPKPTTLCWPIYNVIWDACPKLRENGYIFGRGGHGRAYRPTLDNPFDVPSQSIQDNVSMEKFISYVQQANHGRIVVLTFHGVPDMEHTGVSLDPATFKTMMQYLKDNHYQCVAMRDIAQYIDVVKAANLPHTNANFKEDKNLPPLKDEIPYLANGNNILSFVFGGLTNANISGTTITATVPFATDLTALKPNCEISTGAVVVPAPGTAMDFTKPQEYTVTNRAGSRKIYTVAVNKVPVSRGKDMLSLNLSPTNAVAISGSIVGISVPMTTDVTKLAPTFTVSTFAIATPLSGTVRDFTQPQTYTITAQDGSSKSYTVKVTKSEKANAFTWKAAQAGNWSDASKWLSSPSAEASPDPGGKQDYIISFIHEGKHTVENDLGEGFQINQLNVLKTKGFKLTGKTISLVTNNVTGGLPQIYVTPSGDEQIAIPLHLAADVTVNMNNRGGRVFFASLISGQGSLTLNCPENSDDDYVRWGNLLIANKINTYTGGTIIKGGEVFLLGADQGLGTGPVTLNTGADIRLQGIKGTNPLILNGGTIEGNHSWDAPIIMNGNVRLAGHLDINRMSGGMSGPGSFIQVGTSGPWDRTNDGEIALWGINTYQGTTTIRQGRLILKKAASLYNADQASWTAEKINVHSFATLQITAGGPGEFTGPQIATLLKRLTASVNNNGLMERSVISIDTTHATETVDIADDLTNSNGPGGGSIIFKKSGGGTLKLSGKNTYSGQTTLESGTLIVTSLNSLVGGQSSSSLGTPTDIETAEIIFGQDGKDGECTLIYKGPGETTDRVINFFGKKATETIDQSGSGLLKFTSSFLIFGSNADKKIVLTGSTSGAGEIAGTIENPHSRNGKATTAVTKSGTGTWTLSGINRYTGPTHIDGGVLICANASALGGGPLEIVAGAKLLLNYAGTHAVTSLTINGMTMAAGIYGSTSSSASHQHDTCFAGTGTVTVLGETIIPKR